MKKELLIRKRTQHEWLAWAILILPMILEGLPNFLNVSSIILLLLDILCTFLFVLLLINSKRLCFNKEKSLLILAFGFVVYSFVVYIFRYQSIFYYLWGLRNIFRFYIAFFSYIFFLKSYSIPIYLRFFDVFFWINAIVTLIQYLFMDISGDHLGGLFGTTRGVNRYTNILLIIILIKSVLSYLHGRENILPCIFKLVVAATIAALTELKVFFVETFVIFIIAILLTKFSWKKLLIIVGGGLCLVGGIIILTRLFAEGEFGSMSIKRLLSIATSSKGYTSAGDINRLTAIPQINSRFFTGWTDHFFGLGLGNCDTSAIEIFNSPFHKEYSYFHYSWFCLPMVYLEMGYIGIIFYLGFFVLCCGLARKKLKSNTGDKMYCQISIIMSLICILLTIYDASLRSEIAYVIYFVISLPFIKGSAQSVPGINSNNQSEQSHI